jgi:hypothetical protein
MDRGLANPIPEEELQHLCSAEPNMCRRGYRLYQRLHHRHENRLAKRGILMPFQHLSENFSEDEGHY